MPISADWGKQPLEKVFGLAHEFLNENRDADNWLLHIEPFDPHEPFLRRKSIRIAIRMTIMGRGLIGRLMTM